MKAVALMLRSHRELLLNWFRTKEQVSLGAVEGFNNKAKITSRKAYSFRSYDVMEVALYHSLGDLPELKGTHRFCRRTLFPYLVSEEAYAHSLIANE